MRRLKFRSTVKTRIGFRTDSLGFDELLAVFARHSLDLLTIHARTVKEMYRSAPRYEFIAQAVAALACPVLANGNIYSAAKAEEVLAATGARGLMIGRGVIRNPWLTADKSANSAATLPCLFCPTGSDVAGLRARPLRCGHDKRTARNGTGRGDEEVYELHRARRGTERSISAHHPAGHDRGGILPPHAPEFLEHDEPMPLEPFPIALKERDVMAGETR